MNIHSVSLKGRRDSNEDKHNIILNQNNKNKNLAPVNYFAVYDGHGGKYVSKYLSENLPILFNDKSVKYPISDNYINEKYDYIQNNLKNDPNNRAYHCGSTCAVALHYKNKYDNKYYLTIMNTGDSRIIICRDNIAVPLTKDHKPDWPEEKQRITQLGGSIYYDGYDYRIKDLSVSRAFGDFNATPYVTHKPDIFNYKLSNNDKFIVLACDGLWDKLTNQEVVNFILNEYNNNLINGKLNRSINIAKKLGEYAIFKGSGDNVSVIIAFFNKYK
jgi:protein phosphatase 2C